MSFAQVSFLLEPHNTYRKIVGFDTFGGFPSLSEVDRKGTSLHLREGGYADDSFEELQELARIHESFRLLDVRPQIELVRGDICETVPRYVAENPHLVIALLYMDCDLYEPTKTCLQHLMPRMPRGAVTVFDELNLPNFRVKHRPFRKPSAYAPSSYESFRT
jgi:hypothetical protein